jgi:integrase
MATIERYETKSGTTLYRVRYRKPDNGQTMRRGFKTKRDAQMFASKVEVSKMTGEYVAPADGRATVGELVTGWLARKEKSTAPSYYRMLVSTWRCHVQPRWGRVAVADIDPLGVEDWIAGVKGSPTTVRRCYDVLNGILADAVKGKRLPSNPAKSVENLPRKTGKRHVYLSADDVARLADESGEHRALILTLAYTGLRWGEAIALRVKDVEFLRRRISVHENAVQLGGDFAVGPTKGRIDRSVPVPEFVLNELSVQCKGKAQSALVFGNGTDYLRRPKPDGWFAWAVHRAGIRTAITPHDLRHSCASLAVSAGANVLALQRMLGHSSAAMTLDVYSDLFDDDLDAVASALHGRYGPSSGAASRTV